MSDGRTKSGRIQQLWSIFHNATGERSPNADPRRMSYEQLCQALDTMNFFQSLRTSGCTDSDEQLLKKMCKLLDPEGNKYITWANFQKVMLSILNAPVKGQKHRNPEHDGNRSPTSCVSTAFSSVPTSSELQCLPVSRADEPPPSPPRLTPPQPHPQFSPSPTLRFGSPRIPLTPVCDQWTPVSKSSRHSTDKPVRCATPTQYYPAKSAPSGTPKSVAADRPKPLQQQVGWENQRSPRFATATLHDCGRAYTAQAANRLFSAHTSSSSAKTRWGAEHNEKKPAPKGTPRRNSTGCHKSPPAPTLPPTNKNPLSWALGSGVWEQTPSALPQSQATEQGTAVVAHYAPIGRPPPGGPDTDPLSALLRERSTLGDGNLFRASNCPSPAPSRATSAGLIQTAIDAATHHTLFANIALPKPRSENGSCAIGAPFDSILSSLAGAPSTPALACPTPAPLPDFSQPVTATLSHWRQEVADSISEISHSSTLAPIPCCFQQQQQHIDRTSHSHGADERKGFLQAEAERLSREIKAQEEFLKSSAKQLEERFGYRPSPVPSMPDSESVYHNGGSPRPSAISTVRPESSVSQRPTASQEINAARALRYWPPTSTNEPGSPELTALQRTQLRLAMAL